MHKKTTLFILCCLTLLLTASGAWAKVSSEEAARLGKD